MAETKVNMRRRLGQTLTLLVLIGVGPTTNVVADQFDPLKRVREKAEQLKKKMEGAPAAGSLQNKDFANIPEPDHRMLFKLYVAANADVLDDDLTALDYHYIFNVSPDSQECTSLYQNAQNEVRRQELTAAARASFAKTRAAAASWPKTAVVRLLLNDSLGEYDAAAGAFTLSRMPTSFQEPTGRRLGIMRSRVGSPMPEVYAGPVHEGCSASQMLFSRKAMIPTHFQLELKGGEHIASVPMERTSAEAYLQQQPDRRIAIEVVAEIGPALLRPDDASFNIRGVPARIVAARAVDPVKRTVIHQYPAAAAHTSATPVTPMPSNTAASPPQSTVASPTAKVAPAPASPATSGQSATAWKGDFAAVPEPDFRSLFQLYVAANADLVDDDATAWRHYVMRVPTAGPECTSLRQKFNNDISRQELVAKARAEFRKTLASAASGPKTSLFRLRISDALHEFDSAANAFPLLRMPRLTGGAEPPFYIPRDQSVQGEGILPSVQRLEQLSCPVSSIQLKSNMQVPTEFYLHLERNERLDRLPMDSRAAEAYLDSHRGVMERRVNIELVIEAGPATPNPKASRYFQVPGRVVAARALDPVNGRVVHEYSMGPATPTTTITSVTPAAGESTSAPKPHSSSAGQSAPAAAPRSSAGPEPLTRWRVALLTLRQFPELAGQILLQFTTRLIADEQGIWTRLDQLETTPRPNVNPKRPRFTYEWQKAIEAQPDFARGALLDLFMKPDADWSFVKREREWDERFTAAVAAFLFARDKIEGRQAGFAAQELAPVAKRHLEMAVAAAPTNLWFPMKLVSWDYDFAAQAINFRVGEILETPKGWFDDSYTVMPPSASATANHAPMSTVDGPASQQKELRPGLPEPSGTEKWRQQLQFFAGGLIPNYGALALDRQLFLKSIPVDPKTAERLALKRAELHAKVYVTATRVELGETKIDGKPRKFAVLFATLQKLDVFAPDNELIATVKPEALPAPKVGTATAALPAPKPAAKPPTGPDLGEREREREREQPAGLGTDHCRSENEGCV